MGDYHGRDLPKGKKRPRAGQPPRKESTAKNTAPPESILKAALESKNPPAPKTPAWVTGPSFANVVRASHSRTNQPARVRDPRVGYEDVIEPWPSRVDTAQARLEDTITNTFQANTSGNKLPAMSCSTYVTDTADAVPDIYQASNEVMTSASSCDNLANQPVTITSSGNSALETSFVAWDLPNTSVVKYDTKHWSDLFSKEKVLAKTVQIMNISKIEEGLDLIVVHNTYHCMCVSTRPDIRPVGSSAHEVPTQECFLDRIQTQQVEDLSITFGQVDEHGDGRRPASRRSDRHHSPIGDVIEVIEGQDNRSSYNQFAPRQNFGDDVSLRHPHYLLGPQRNPRGPEATSPLYHDFTAHLDQNSPPYRRYRHHIPSPPPPITPPLYFVAGPFHQYHTNTRHDHAYFTNFRPINFQSSARFRLPPSIHFIQDSGIRIPQHNQFQHYHHIYNVLSPYPSYIRQYSPENIQHHHSRIIPDHPLLPEVPQIALTAHSPHFPPLMTRLEESLNQARHLEESINPDYVPLDLSFNQRGSQNSSLNSSLGECYSRQLNPAAEPPNVVSHSASRPSYDNPLSLFANNYNIFGSNNNNDKDYSELHNSCLKHLLKRDPPPSPDSPMVHVQYNLFPNSPEITAKSYLEVASDQIVYQDEVTITSSTSPVASERPAPNSTGEAGLPTDPPPTSPSTTTPSDSLPSTTLHQTSLPKVSIVNGIPEVSALGGIPVNVRRRLNKFKSGRGRRSAANRPT